jgi:hypothetical protein
VDTGFGFEIGGLDFSCAVKSAGFAVADLRVWRNPNYQKGDKGNWGFYYLSVRNLFSEKGVTEGSSTSG